MANFSQIGKTLVDFQNLDMLKARHIFENIALADLVKKAKESSLSQVGQALSDLKKIDDAKTQRIFQNYSKR
jgi:hypothetical protein